LRGSDLEWTSRWDEQDSLSITFFDYGAGVEVPYSSRDAAPKRNLRTLNYQFDSGPGIFREDAPSNDAEQHHAADASQPFRSVPSWQPLAPGSHG
jgi:hypothetical protein